MEVKVARKVERDLLKKSRVDVLDVGGREREYERE